jgi:hypothetical protein
LGDALSLRCALLRAQEQALNQVSQVGRPVPWAPFQKHKNAETLKRGKLKR